MVDTIGDSEPDMDMPTSGMIIPDGKSDNDLMDRTVSINGKPQGKVSDYFTKEQAENHYKGQGKYKKGGKVHGQMPKKRFDKKARGGSIHIKPENRGKFTAKAKAAGKTVHEYAQEKKKVGGELGKEANFAANAEKWSKK